MQCWVIHCRGNGTLCRTSAALDSWIMRISANSMVRRSLCATSQIRTKNCFAKVCSLACGSFEITHGLHCTADFLMVSKNLPNEVIHVRFGVAQQQRITLLM